MVKLKNMAYSQQVKCFDIFLLLGNSDTFKGFIGMMGDSMFDETTVNIIECIWQY